MRELVGGSGEADSRSWATGSTDLRCWAGSSGEKVNFFRANARARVGAIARVPYAYSLEIRGICDRMLAETLRHFASTETNLVGFPRFRMV